MRILTMLAAHWTAEIDKIAFTVFGRDVAWYGIIITSSMLLGLIISAKRGKKFRFKPDDVLESFLFVIPVAIIFARIGYVMVRPEYFPSNFGKDDLINLIAIWDGGVTITTGLLGGLIGSLIWSKVRKLDLILFLDVALPAVLLAQAFGRWGNFFNQEIYGAAVTNPELQFFPYAVFISAKGGFYQAAFFYESMLNLIGFILLMCVLKRLRIRGAGVLGYLTAYPTIRAIMEFIRDDGDIYKVINYTQIIMALVALVSLTALIIITIKERRKGAVVWYSKGIPDADYFNARLKIVGEERENDIEAAKGQLIVFGKRRRRRPANKSKKRKK